MMNKNKDKKNNKITQKKNNDKYNDNKYYIYTLDGQHRLSNIIFIKLEI